MMLYLLPKQQTIPQEIQTTIAIPTDPEYFNADEGDTKIPDPIITAKITLTAENSPIRRFKRTPPFSLSIFSAVIDFSDLKLLLFLKRIEISVFQKDHW